jgi:hypothetical protein
MQEHQAQEFTPTRRTSNVVWLWGVAVVLLLWAAIVGVIGGVSGRLLDVALDFKLIVPFVLFLSGWTGGWIWRRSHTPDGARMESQ